MKLSDHGTADPAAYGVVYDPLPSYPYNQWTSDTVPAILLNPTSGVYAISANNLQAFGSKITIFTRRFGSVSLTRFWAIQCSFIALTTLPKGTPPHDLVSGVHAMSSQ